MLVERDVIRIILEFAAELCLSAGLTTYIHTYLFQNDDFEAGTVCDEYEIRYAGRMPFQSRDKEAEV